jgi:spore maturation protein CgeB
MHKKKIIIMGPPCGHYTTSVARGFRSNGFESLAFEYDEGPRSIHHRFLRAALPKCWEDYRHDKNERLLGEVLKESKNASAVIVIKGDAIPFERMQQLKAEVGCPLVTWFMDSCALVERGMDRAKLSDYLFFFEGEDREALQTAGVRCRHIFLAYDECWYQPIEHITPSIDVSFVGNPYPNRNAFFDELSLELGKGTFKCRFYGPFVSLRRPWNLGALARKYPHAISNFRHKTQLEHEQINRINASSKVAMNLLHLQSLYSLNMRAFETCGSGCFQLIQALPAVSECFRIGQDVETFSTAGEAADKVRFYLANNRSRERIAGSGLQRALERHTMRTRVHEMVCVMKDEGLF